MLELVSYSQSSCGDRVMCTIIDNKLTLGNNLPPQNDHGRRPVTREMFSGPGRVSPGPETVVHINDISAQSGPSTSGRLGYQMLKRVTNLIIQFV